MELTRLIDALPALVWTALADGRAEFINRRWCDYCGLTTEQATGFDWQSAIHPEDRREALDRWQAFLESGQPGELVTRLRRHDGAYRRFLVSAAPVRDGSGQILKWCGINTDIEDQLQAEEALRLRETHFRSIFDGLPAMVTLLRPEGSLDVANRHTLEFFGAPTQELKQRWHGTSYHPDDHQLVMEAWQQAQHTGAPYEFEARQRRHDGTYRWMRVRGLPLHDDRGQIVNWYCLQTDIDDLRRAHIHLTEAQTLSKTGSFTWDVQADHHSWSAEIHRIFGFDPTAKVTLGMILAAIHPEDKAGAEAVIGRAVVGEDFELVFRIVTPAGVKYAHVVGHRNRQIPDRPVFLGALQDVTEAKLAEEALRASEHEARLMVDSIPGLIAVFDAAGVVQHVNRQVVDYFGGTSEDLKSWQFRDVIHPEDLPRAVEVFQRSITCGDPFEFEVRGRRFDGVYRWFQSRGLPLRDRNGAIVRWYNVLVDIDERRRAEEVLEAREAELRRAHYHLTEGQRLSHTGSFTSDPAVDEHNWSDEFYRICEFEPGTKASIQRLRDIVDPRDLALYDSVIQRGLTGEDFELVFRIVTPGAGVKHVRGVGRAVEQKAGRPLFVGAIQDVTKSKLAQEALEIQAAEIRRAYDFLSEGQRLSRTGSFISLLPEDEHHWSAELYRIFELDPATQCTTQAVRNLIEPEDLPSFDTGIERCWKGGDFDLVFRIRTPRGNAKHVHAVARLVERSTEQLKLVGAIQDVTESKLAEQALNRARTELAHVSRAMTLGTLTASMAHEVNQPLSGIITNATTCLRMLSADPPNLDGARATAQRTLRDGNRASEVINRLRTLFSRKQPKEEPVDLNDAAREVLALSSNELQRSRVVLRTDFQQELPTVTGDRVQLQQVILNLVLNAAEAMTNVDERPRDLLVATAQQAPSQVRLWVRDCGVGIDPKNSEKLFQTFYTTKSQGMGVGLSISRSIIESHGGRLSAMANGDGPGATFTFSVPSLTASTVQSAGIHS